jgi:Dynein heavy chain C-terminal domain
MHLTSHPSLSISLSLPFALSSSPFSLSLSLSLSSSLPFSPSLSPLSPPLSFYSIAINQVPALWVSAAYPSLKPCAAWSEDLLDRLAFLQGEGRERRSVKWRGEDKGMREENGKECAERGIEFNSEGCE